MEKEWEKIGMYDAFVDVYEHVLFLPNTIISVQLCMSRQFRAYEIGRYVTACPRLPSTRRG
jgi:hypothetical protein